MPTPLLRRREALILGAGGLASVALGATFWNDLFPTSERPLRRGPGYGPLAKPDANGLRLPEGFSSRVIARGQEQVEGTGHAWHLASDGSATYRTRGGGWILVSNSEDLHGGAGAIRFAADGTVEDAYPILSDTTANCSGGATPWGTWLSCEEVEEGRVWECDPSGEKRAKVHPAMGVFKHEAAAVDPAHRCVYLTEDLADGGLYRFVPERWPDLSAGRLEIAVVGGERLRWKRVPDPAARRVPTRRQVAGSTEFKRGEGIFLDGHTLYVSTTVDSRVHALDTRSGRIRVIYDGLASQEAPLLRVDQLTASRAHEVFVCEDIATDEMSMGVISPGRKVSRFLAATGAEHDGSELTGVTFDPSGDRLYFASQRARKTGGIYEVTGPFRRAT